MCLTVRGAQHVPCFVIPIDVAPIVDGLQVRKDPIEGRWACALCQFVLVPTTGMRVWVARGGDVVVNICVVCWSADDGAVLWCP